MLYPKEIESSMFHPDEPNEPIEYMINKHERTKDMVKDVIFFDDFFDGLNLLDFIETINTIQIRQDNQYMFIQY